MICHIMKYKWLKKESNYVVTCKYFRLISRRPEQDVGSTESIYKLQITKQFDLLLNNSDRMTYICIIFKLSFLEIISATVRINSSSIPYDLPCVYVEYYVIVL